MCLLAFLSNGRGCGGLQHEHATLQISTASVISMRNMLMPPVSGCASGWLLVNNLQLSNSMLVGRRHQLPCPVTKWHLHATTYRATTQVQGMLFKLSMKQVL